MTSVFKTLFWVKDVFAAEFGNSDVQSNYSRLYAWMANQLGHMTLGLATALAYVWIYETLHDLAAYDSGGWFAGWGALLLNFAGFVMLVGTGSLVILVRYKASGHQENWDHRNRVYPLSPTVGLWVGLGIGGLLILLFFRILVMEPGVTDPALIEVYAHVGAALTLAGAITILAKDWRAMVLGYLFVMGAVWLTISESPIFAGSKDTVAVALIMALAVVLFATARTYDDKDDKVRGGPAMLNAAAIVVLTTVLFAGLDEAAFILDGRAAEWVGIDTPQWRHAFTAAIAALALWLVKEFGSDIPLVSVEIANAARVRHGHGHADYKEIERAYFADAVWDARTDGVFYVTGAVIAVALLTDTGLMQTTWASGPDFLGLLFFGLIFLLSGRRWAYRQQALDLVGSPYASRLAVLQNAVELRVMHGNKLGPPRDDPMSVLLEFARGGLRRFGQIEDTPTLVDFDHLVILGKLGSGKTPLGIAISSEAALRDLEAKIGVPFADPIRPRKSHLSRTEIPDKPYEESGRRAAAYITLKNLYTMTRHIRLSAKEKKTPEEQAEARADLVKWLGKEWKRRNLIGIVPEDTTMEEAARLPGPVDLLVIDDINLALPGVSGSSRENLDAAKAKAIEARQIEVMQDSQDVRMLEEILPALPQHRDQHTVWMVDVTSLPPFVRSNQADHRNSDQDMPDTLEPLLCTLSAGLRSPGTDEPARIALAFVEMDEIKEN